jgi:hypothetical protein
MFNEYQFSKMLCKKIGKIMEQHALKNVNNCLKTNIYSYSDTLGGQSSNLCINAVYFFNTSAI